MSEERIVIEGRTWVSLETLATVYECEVTWVRTVYEHGLLGPGRQHAGHTVVASRSIERLAVVRRLHRHYGIALDLVDTFLD